MRPLMLVLMILLLPLRGWMGDAMATEMAVGKTTSVMQQVQPAQQPQIAIIKIAGQAYEISDTSHFGHEDTAPDTSSALLDCAGHSSDQAFQQTAGQNEDGNGHCGSCQFCQVCHTVALFLPAVTPITIIQALGLPQTGATQFTSAQTALRQKPPIS